MKIIGKTTSDSLVVGDIFKFFDTHGLPLADIFNICIKNSLQPCWLDFYNQAHTHGWSHKTIIIRLRDALCDSYGNDYANIVIEKLDKSSSQ